MTPVDVARVNMNKLFPIKMVTSILLIVLIIVLIN